jgi:hypothetical protein
MSVAHFAVKAKSCLMIATSDSLRLAGNVPSQVSVA